jgi:hypothetical protein
MVIQFLSFADQSPLPTVTVWNSTYTTSYSTTVAQLGSANSYTATFDASALSGYYWVVVAGTDYEQTFAIKIVDNKIPQYTAGTIDELKQMEGGRYSETAVSTAALTLSSGHNAIIASEIESTGGGGAALVLNGGSQSVQSQLIYSSLYDGIIMTAGQHAVDCEFISAGSDAIASEGSGSVTVKAHHIVCDSCCNMESAGIITLTAESISCGASLIEATDSGVINIQSHRISTPNVIVQTPGLQVTIKDAVIGGLLEPVACLAGTLELINCYIRGNLTQSGTGVVRMSNTVVTGTITGTISEHHDLTQQDIRDAMKLAPSAGAAAANSIDDKIDSIELDVLPYTGSTPDRTAGTTITTFYKEQPSVTINLDGANLDNLDLKFVVENNFREDILVVPNASISRNVDQFTVTITTAVTNTVGSYSWSLRNTANDVILGHGVLKNIYAAYDN